MRSRDLLVRCLARQEGNVWVAICLDFDLAAQGVSCNEAIKKLEGQIRDYLHDAVVGSDVAAAPWLLRRRAPLPYWFAWYKAKLLHHVLHIASRNKPIERPLPLTLAHA
jgi:hypothetical protein